MNEKSNCPVTGKNKKTIVGGGTTNIDWWTKRKIIAIKMTLGENILPIRVKSLCRIMSQKNAPKYQIVIPTIIATSAVTYFDPTSCALVTGKLSVNNSVDFFFSIMIYSDDKYEMVMYPYIMNTSQE